ncbi:hypothetical protein [Taklimakanibacter lacteus]|uniref:hypothetical protein n=1 Tax=Taklimakanibacter lacteus TaxID=2268456 RepID=UPI0013C4ADBE
MDSIPLWRWFLSRTGLGRGGPRRWMILGLAVVLVLLGQWLASVSPKSLEDFAWKMVDDLGQIQPFVLVPEFFRQLSSCDNPYGCDWTLLINPIRYPVTAFTTLRDILSASSDIALGVFVLALAVGGITLVLLWKRHVKRNETDWHILDIAALSALLPFAVSLTALALQILAIGLFWLFGSLIGLVLFLLGTFGWLLSVIGFLRQVQGTADRLDTIANTVIGAPTPPHDPKS